MFEVQSQQPGNFSLHVQDRVRGVQLTHLQSHYLFRDRFGRPGKGNDKGQGRGPGEDRTAPVHGADPEGA